MKTKTILLLAFFFCNILIVAGQSDVEYKKEKKIQRQKIKSQFKALKIGDTIQIPYSTLYRHDGTERTSLTVYTAYSDNENYDCVIIGVITEKNQKIEKGYDRRGYNVAYKVISINKCGDYPIVYEDKEITIGQIIKHNMKYFKVIAKNTAANSG